MSAVPREDTMATKKPNAPATDAAPAGKKAAAPAKAPAKKK